MRPYPNVLQHGLWGLLRFIAVKTEIFRDQREQIDTGELLSLCWQSRVHRVDFFLATVRMLVSSIDWCCRKKVEYFSLFSWPLKVPCVEENLCHCAGGSC